MPGNFETAQPLTETCPAKTSSTSSTSTSGTIWSSTMVSVACSEPSSCAQYIGATRPGVPSAPPKSWPPPVRCAENTIGPPGW